MTTGAYSAVSRLSQADIERVVWLERHDMGEPTPSHYQSDTPLHFIQYLDYFLDKLQDCDNCLVAHKVFFALGLSCTSKWEVQPMSASQMAHICGISRTSVYDGLNAIKPTGIFTRDPKTKLIAGTINPPPDPQPKPNGDNDERTEYPPAR